MCYILYFISHTSIALPDNRTGENMNIKEVTKKDGTIVYRTNIYLGVDSLTGKKVQTTATAKTRKMCEIKANQAINQFISNGSTIAREKVVFNNFNALAMSWFDSYKLTVKANSIRGANNFLKVYILPALGSYQLKKINPVLLQGLVNQWAKNANTSPIKDGKREKGKCKDYKLLLNYIKRILDYGMQLGAIDSNPAMQVRPPKLKSRTTTKIKYFDNAELKTFLSYLDNLAYTTSNQRHVTLYRFLLATGLRIGECLALSWSDIDFNDHTVSITKTVVRVINKAELIQEGAKTTESNRLVTLDMDTMALLKAWKKRQDNGTINLVDKLIFENLKHTITYANELVRSEEHT